MKPWAATAETGVTLAKRPVGGAAGAVRPGRRLGDGVAVVVRLCPEGGNRGLGGSILSESGARDPVRCMAGRHCGRHAKWAQRGDVGSPRRVRRG